jgi:4-nitrophenyl phosphatase
LTSLTLDLRTIRAVASDMDGVLWRGTEILPGAVEFFQFLTQCGIPYVMATNNSTKTVHDYVSRLRGLNIPAEPSQILSSVVVTGDYLVKHYPVGTPIFVLGSEALEAAMMELGYVVDPDHAKVVIVGLDYRLTYDRLRIAGQRILAGATFIGTNSDPTLPIPDGLIPGSGTLIAALQTMTQREPILMGKPQSTMFLTAVERLGATAATTLMIGDRLETDIKGAKAVGMATALVLTGISSDDEIQNDYTPDAVFDDLAALLAQWQRALQE